MRDTYTAATGRSLAVLSRSRAKAAAITAVVLLASACSGSAAGGGSSGGTAGGGTVTVGLATTLSGALSVSANGGQQGIEMAVKDLNAKGGVLGRQVKLVSEDDQVTPAIGASDVRSLILNNKAVALFGPLASSVAASEEAVSAQYKVPLMLFMANDAGLTTTTFTKYVYSVVPNTNMEPRAVAEYLAKVSGGKQITIGTFAPDYSFGHDSVTGFLNALKTLKVNFKLVDQQFPPLNESNIAPYLTKLVAAAPDYVYNAQFGSDLVTFTKQAEGYDFFNHTKVIAMYGTQELTSLGANVPAGTIDFNRAPFWAMGSGITAWAKRYQATYGVLPSEWSLLGYTAVQTWAAGVTKAGSFDGDKLATALAGATVPTIRGDLTIRACDHQAEVPEYIGVLTKTPNPVYGMPLWQAGSAFIAPWADISSPC
jgi:branched-chain amino acid transport system substrate-binding protein